MSENVQHIFSHQGNAYQNFVDILYYPTQKEVIIKIGKRKTQNKTKQKQPSVVCMAIISAQWEIKAGEFQVQEQPEYLTRSCLKIKKG